MNKKKVFRKLEKYLKLMRYVKIRRSKGGFEEAVTGFILKMSSDFILIQESDEFRILGYQIIPINTIKHVRYNKHDKKVYRILKEEGLLNDVKLKYQIDMTDFSSICRDIRKTGLTIISECEHPKLNYFCIGPLKKINKKSISIRYFNAQGVLNKKNTKHKFKDITKLSFDDHYANVFSRYITKK